MVTIRETNGEDDDILSNLGEILKGHHVNNFIANIVMEDKKLNRKPTVEDIIKWPTNNKNYVLFKQRLINHGNDLKFQHKCPNVNCKNYLEDKVQRLEDTIDKFDGNLADEKYVPKNSFSIRKYKPGNDVMVEFETSSNKKFRFKILTGELEQNELEIDEGSISRNTKLLIRELELFNKNSWSRLENFRSIPSREMKEVRQKVIDMDPTFDPIINFNCPSCKAPYQLPLFQIPNFYFPEDMISM